MANTDHRARAQWSEPGSFLQGRRGERDVAVELAKATEHARRSVSGLSDEVARYSQEIPRTSEATCCIVNLSAVPFGVDSAWMVKIRG